MANPEHVKILKQGVEIWNKWREEHKEVQADLSAIDFGRADLTGARLIGADLRDACLIGADLYEANLSGANLSKAMLTEAYLAQADLSEVNLSGANLCRALLMEADLYGANLSSAYLPEADLSQAYLTLADLSEANLSEANLSNALLLKAKLFKTNLVGAKLVGTDLEGANIENCSIYGVSVWNVDLSETTQKDLVITPEGEPKVVVDNLEVAQFVYLLLNNNKIRDVIDTIGEKGVLILGRFTEERKAVLDAIRNELRDLGFVPMMFDFERPTQRDFTETIKTLAGLSRFIIADITNPKSSPLELQAVMPDYMIPFVPIIHEGEQPFAMFRDLKQKYGKWVLDVLQYDSAENLVGVFDKAVVRPALKMSDDLLLKKAETIRTRHVKDYEQN